MSPTAVPQRSESGTWLASYGELQNSLFLSLARPLGMAGAGGRDAFGDLFQIAVTAAGYASATASRSATRAPSCAR